MAPNMTEVRKVTRIAVWCTVCVFPIFWSIFIVARFIPAWWISIPYGVIAAIATIAFGAVAGAHWMERFDLLEKMKP